MKLMELGFVLAAEQQMPASLPCAFAFTAFQTSGTKKSSLTLRCGEMDRDLSVSVGMEEHPPDAASQKLNTTEPVTAGKSLQDVRLKADAPGTKREVKDYITTSKGTDSATN
ncbi:hypothetical protein WISP_139004 [Willisornis vidua]|uniref:Uncharacterized protein n=1 Tax=Willisornis vidua TaxID=1566151 RepID=A0ABQ9CNI6_9PASS|nr:hypothetical protein WISP_139004 [Willisornis vidua]